MGYFQYEQIFQGLK